MDEYKEGLLKHVEKLFKKTQEIIAKKRGEVKRVQFKNFLSYFSYYQQENVDKRKGKHRERSWKDAMADKPLNRGFRDKKKKTREPTTEQLENMIEFFERELEKIDGPTPREMLNSLIYRQISQDLMKKWAPQYQQNPINNSYYKTVKLVKGINIPKGSTQIPWIWT